MIYLPDRYAQNYLRPDQRRIKSRSWTKTKVLKRKDRRETFCCVITLSFRVDFSVSQSMHDTVQACEWDCSRGKEKSFTCSFTFRPLTFSTLSSALLMCVFMNSLTNSFLNLLAMSARSGAPFTFYRKMGKKKRKEGDDASGRSLLRRMLCSASSPTTKQR